MTRLRLILGGLGAIVVLAGAWASPIALRQMDSFVVEQVEVHGTRYLAPEAVLEASGIAVGSSLWDDAASWQAALERHPMIRSARIDRRLPSTLRITVTETEPVALVRTPALEAVDGRGRLLPIAPEAVGLDLPIVAGAVSIGGDGLIEHAATREALAAFERLRAAEPDLAAAVSEIGVARGELRLLLRVRQPAVARVDFDAGATQLRQVRLALEDLADRGELERLRVLDGRFREQVVVELYPQQTS